MPDPNIGDLQYVTSTMLHDDKDGQLFISTEVDVTPVSRVVSEPRPVIETILEYRDSMRRPDGRWMKGGKTRYAAVLRNLIGTLESEYNSLDNVAVDFETKVPRAS